MPRAASRSSYRISSSARGSFRNPRVSGAWIALSHWATQGAYYPALEQDGSFAGTRFGPLSLALNAGAHALFDDPVIGPKLLHAIYMAALIAGLWVVLGPLGLPRHTRLLLATAPLATWIGWTVSPCDSMLCTWLRSAKPTGSAPFSASGCAPEASRLGPP